MTIDDIINLLDFKFVIIFIIILGISIEMVKVRTKIEKQGTKLEKQIKEQDTKIKEQEYIITALTNCIHPEHEKRVKLASVIILSSDETTHVGVGFFVSDKIVLTVSHNIIFDENNKLIKSYKNQMISVKVSLDDGNVPAKIIKLKLVDHNPHLDIAILAYDNGSHPYFIKLPKKEINFSLSNRVNWALINFSIGLSNASERLFDHSATVVPITVIRHHPRHIAYIGSCFSGDSGSSVVLSTTGDVVAMHLESINEIDKIIVEDFDNCDMTSVAQSINSIISGLTQGYLGLRLDSGEVKDSIEKYINEYNN